MFTDYKHIRSPELTSCICSQSHTTWKGWHDIIHIKVFWKVKCTVYGDLGVQQFNVQQFSFTAVSQLNLCYQYTTLIASREHKVNVNLPFSFLMYSRDQIQHHLTSHCPIPVYHDFSTGPGKWGRENKRGFGPMMIIPKCKDNGFYSFYYCCDFHGLHTLLSHFKWDDTKRYLR